MPIKDKEKAREYKRLWMVKYRQQKNNVEPVEPSLCPRCPELEKRIRELKKQLQAVATLPATYIDGLLEEMREKHRKEVETKLLKIQKLTQQIEKLHSKNDETQLVRGIKI